MSRSTEPRTSALAGLSEGQVDVLQRVAELKSSKEIARELGISPHTVDQRLKRVQSLWQVSSRFEAARLYTAAAAATAASPAHQPLVYPSSVLSDASSFGDVSGAAGAMNPSSGRPNEGLREAQGQFHAAEHPAFTRPWSSVLFEAGRRNDLSPLARTVVIAAITLAALLSLAAVVSLAEGLSRII